MALSLEVIIPSTVAIAVSVMTFVLNNRMSKHTVTKDVMAELRTQVGELTKRLEDCERFREHLSRENLDLLRNVVKRINE